MMITCYYIYSTDCVNKHEDTHCDDLRDAKKCDTLFGKLFCQKTCGLCDSGNIVALYFFISTLFSCYNTLFYTYFWLFTILDPDCESQKRSKDAPTKGHCTNGSIVVTNSI